MISYDERSDDQMLVDYGFSHGPGENQMTFLKITLREIVELRVSQSHMIILIYGKINVTRYKTLELHLGRYLEDIFEKFISKISDHRLKITQTGPSYDVLAFLVSILPQVCSLRNSTELENEANKVMELMMIRRIAEIEKIDELEAQEFVNEKKYPCAVGSFRSEKSIN